jgi:hypothetical protein
VRLGGGFGAAACFLGGGERHARFHQERVDRQETRGRECGGVAFESPSA